MSIIKSMGARIRQRRLALGITNYQDHARLHRINENTWRKAEQGLSDCNRISTYIKIADALDIEYDELYGGLKHDNRQTQTEAKELTAARERSS